MTTHPPDVSAERVARDLLEIGAVSLSPEKPFRWASGRLAPVYCDNRLTMRYPRVRGRIAASFESAIKRVGWPCDVVVGTATAGIPHAAWLAARVELPMAYVRSEAKAHGKKRRIEGAPPPGSRAVVIEDLISTGMSSVAVVEPLREAGIEVSGIMSIFSYGLEVAEEAFDQAGVDAFSLCTFGTLVDLAERDSLLPARQIASLRRWYSDPEAWSNERLAAD
ncbi:MAG: orotate phosphoribosyltransferase [Rhodothermales bacterium]|nr:orotate phosphoribosyltransferase [Rhodothermales bacterium]